MVGAQTGLLGAAGAVRQAVLGAIALLVVAPSCSAATAIPSATVMRQARVVKVVDGDTIKVQLDGREESCRLLGIDTPELSYGQVSAQLDRLAEHTPEPDRAELISAIAIVRRNARFAEERARAARAALTDIVGGRAVTIVQDSIQPARDRYGRLLVFVEVDGLDVNAELVRRGLAIVDERFECERLGAYLEVRTKEEATGNSGTD